ncbi:MAG: tripartite tricarboxylate transporter substrate binding protein [Burkholderiales bacterium]|nr:tripartite tricarboxylate transporter substrate binding protein [Burkholderiales bacterium]
MKVSTVRRHHRTIALGVVAVTVSAILFPGAAAAQTYPSRPIRLIAPSSTGGGIDALARIMAQASGTLGQQIVVENRGGANGMIGTELAAKAPPDGYTLLLGFTGAIAVNVSLYGKVPYDPVRDLAPITQITSSPVLVVAHPSLPVRSIPELIKLDKARPGQLTYGTGGTGTGSHLTMELFNLAAGTRLLHVPYKGIGPALTDVLGGHISLMVSAPLSSAPHVQSGKLRGLAVTGRSRLAALPNVPTMIESGLPGFESTAWFGLLAPAGTPPAIVARLHKEFVALLQRPDVREQISRTGADPVGNTPEEFAAYIKSEIVKWGKVVKAAGIKAD